MSKFISFERASFEERLAGPTGSVIDSVTGSELSPVKQDFYGTAGFSSLSVRSLSGQVVGHVIVYQDPIPDIEPVIHTASSFSNKMNQQLMRGKNVH